MWGENTTPDDTTRTTAIEGLKTIYAGRYTTSQSANGKVMVSASGEGKAFSYQLPEGMSVAQIDEATFGAIQYLEAYTLDQINADLFRRRRNVAFASIGAC